MPPKPIPRCRIASRSRHTAICIGAAGCRSRRVHVAEFARGRWGMGVSKRIEYGSVVCVSPVALLSRWRCVRRQSSHPPRPASARSHHGAGRHAHARYASHHIRRHFAYRHYRHHRLLRAHRAGSAAWRKCGPAALPMRMQVLLVQPVRACVERDGRRNGRLGRLRFIGRRCRSAPLSSAAIPPAAAACGARGS